MKKKNVNAINADKRVQSTRERREKKVTRELNRDLKKAAKVTPLLRAPKSAKGLVKRVESGLHPGSSLGVWARQLADPFGQEGALCPINYNPAPSFIQSSARTTSTNLNLSVAAGSTTQLLLMPGHGPPVGAQVSASIGAYGMDAVSYHANDQTINATTFSIGPMYKRDNVGLKPPAIGALYSALTLGLTGGPSNNAFNAAVEWDVDLPYEANTVLVGGGHTRWMLNSMGVKIHNITPEIYRGGSVVSVQPNNTTLMTSLANQTDFEVFPTFKDHGCADSVEISWVPRPQDLAFWHGAENNSAGSAATAWLGPAILIWFNNPTANAISFTYEVVCHWNLAGNYLNPIGGPSPHSPEAKPAIEKTISVLSNTAHTAASAFKVMSAAVQHSGISSVGTFAAKAAPIVAGAAHVLGRFGY